MSNLESTQSNISRIKTTTIKIMAAILAILAVVWLIMTLVSGSRISLESTSSTATGFQSMFWEFGGLFLLVVLGFRCLEKGEKFSRTLALIGFVAGVIGFLLEVAMVCGMFSLSLTSEASIITKLMFVTLATSITSIGIALVALIEDNDGAVDLLKIISTICGFGFWAVVIVMAFIDWNIALGSALKMITVLSVLGSCFVVCAGVALVMSWFGLKDKIDRALLKIEQIDSNDGTAQFGGGLSEDVIEKNVQARLAEEKAKAEREKMPPLQPEEMAPTVSRDSEVKIEKPIDLSAGVETPRQ